jgi:hypothetical protein
MTGLLVVLFGILPVIVLALLALAPLTGGLAMLLEEPAKGALFTVWGIAGMAGARTLLRVWSGTFTENTVPGLLAGIAAVAPLNYAILQNPDMPGSLVPLYFTLSPAIVAAGYLVGLIRTEVS